MKKVKEKPKRHSRHKQKSQKGRELWNDEGTFRQEQPARLTKKEEGGPGPSVVTCGLGPDSTPAEAKGGGQRTEGDGQGNITERLAGAQSGGTSA